ncbi:MAG TPA: phage holin family protein [Gaiellaceae bacterium]
MLALLIGWVILAVAFAITSWLLPGMDVSGGVWSYLWVSALFGIVNAIAGALLLRIGRAPQSMLLMGLLSLLLSAVLLAVTDALSDSLTIDDFWWTAIWAAIVLAIVTVFLEVVVFSLLFRRAERRA